MVWRYNYINICIYEYASERSERAKDFFLRFHILKLLFPSIFCWYFRYFVSETYISSGLKLHLHTWLYTQCSFLLLLMVWRYIYKWQYTDKTLKLRKFMYASEFRKFSSHFHILKLLFLSIFGWYFRYLVVTNDMTVSAYMYRQISKCTDKIPNYWPPPPPPGYASASEWILCKRGFKSLGNVWPCVPILYSITN